MDWMQPSVLVGRSLKSNITPNFAPRLLIGNTTIPGKDFFLPNMNVHFCNVSDRQKVEATLKEMVEALVEEFLQPTLNNLTPRPE